MTEDERRERRRESRRRSYYKHRKTELEAARRYRRNNREKIAARARKTSLAYRRSHRKQVNARNTLRRAVRSGKIVRPDICQLCGEVGRVEAHHPDYSKPLDVQWLCQLCHCEVDGRISFANTRRLLADGRWELVAVYDETPGRGSRKP